LLNFRIANKNDLSDINKIAKQVHDLHVSLRDDLYKPHQEIITASLFNQLLKEALVYIVEKDNIVVAYSVAYIRNVDLPILVKRRIFFIDALGVDSNYHRLKVGSFLMEELENLAINNNCDSIELQVASKNKNALKFYEKIGLNKKTHILEKKLIK